MASLSLHTQIYRPVEQVFAFVTTPENDFLWQYGTLASSQISKGEMGIGSLFRTTGHFMGRRIESIYEVIEFESNKKYGFKSLSGPVDSHTVYTFEITKSGTKISVISETNPRGVSRTDDVIAERKFRKQCKENLALLKSMLETHQTVNI